MAAGQTLHFSTCSAVIICHTLFQIQMYFWICNFINFQFLESEQIPIHLWPSDSSVQHLNLAPRQISSLKSGCYWREEMKVQLISLPVNQSFEALTKSLSFKARRHESLCKYTLSNMMKLYICKISRKSIAICGITTRNFEF